MLLTGKEEPPSAGLSDDEAELLKYFNQLPEKEKIRLVSRAETIADMYAEAASKPIHPIISVKHSVYSVSAGTGDMLDTDEWDTIDVPDSPEARKADFCLTIHGNSMEPVYYNGDIVLVKEQQSVKRDRSAYSLSKAVVTSRSSVGTDLFRLTRNMMISFFPIMLRKIYGAADLSSAEFNV